MEMAFICHCDIAIAGFFNRATLCVSAVFAVARCPSVRPSVAFLDCIHAAEDVILLIRPDSSITLVFLTPCADTQFQGEAFSGDAKYTGVGKIGHFRQKSPSISETVRDRPMVAMEH